MIRVTQDITGKYGNCFAACIASLLEMPLSPSWARRGCTARSVPWKPGFPWNGNAGHYPPR